MMKGISALFLAILIIFNCFVFVEGDKIVLLVYCETVYDLIPIAEVLNILEKLGRGEIDLSDHFLETYAFKPMF